MRCNAEYLRMDFSLALQIQCTSAAYILIQKYSKINDSQPHLSIHPLVHRLLLVICTAQFARTYLEIGEAQIHSIVQQRIRTYVASICFSCLRASMIFRL